LPAGRSWRSLPGDHDRHDHDLDLHRDAQPSVAEDRHAGLMLHICCIRAGELFAPAYVDILFDSVRRNLADGFEGEFVCFTDQPD
jgi:hypothetical protein